MPFLQWLPFQHEALQQVNFLGRSSVVRTSESQSDSTSLRATNTRWDYLVNNLDKEWWLLGGIGREEMVEQNSKFHLGVSSDLLHNHLSVLARMKILLFLLLLM